MLSPEDFLTEAQGSHASLEQCTAVLRAVLEEFGAHFALVVLAVLDRAGADVDASPIPVDSDPFMDSRSPPSSHRHMSGFIRDMNGGDSPVFSPTSERRCVRGAARWGGEGAGPCPAERVT